MPETTPIETLDRRGWGHKVRCVIRLTNMGEMDRRLYVRSIWLAVPRPTEWQHIGNQIGAAFIAAQAHFVSLARRCRTLA